MLAYRGDLGLDTGTPQSVYALQKKDLKAIRDAEGKPLRLDLAMGRSARLPDGLGTVTFDGLSRYVKLQVSHTPGQLIALSGVVLALVGLLGSLFIRPRRIWVRTRREGGRTLVEVAGLDRSAGGDLSGEIEGSSPPCGSRRPPDHRAASSRAGKQTAGHAPAQSGQTSRESS